MPRTETARHRKAFEAWYAANRDFGVISQNLATPGRTLRGWADAYEWAERADQRDQEAARIAEQEAIAAKVREIAEANQAIKDMRKRHAQILMLMQTRVIENLQRFHREDLSLREMAYVLDLCIKNERLSRGEPTEITDERQRLVKRFEEMTEDELDAYIVERERQIAAEQALNVGDALRIVG